MLKIDPEDEEDEDAETEVLNPDGTVNRAATRANQAQEARDTVILLPGTHDGWQNRPNDGTREMDGYDGGGEGVPVGTDQQPVVEEEPSATTESRTPIKPLTIKTSQITTPHHRR